MNDVMSMKNNERIIITFDVGGQIYRIPKETLLRFPGTMLCMTISDIETSNNDNDPIYIDRNGNRFQYVLNYMRNHNNSSDSSFCLPSSINRVEFFRDMDFYGFPCYHHDTFFPKDVMYYLNGIQYHHIVWDISNASYGLQFDNYHHDVKRIDDKLSIHGNNEFAWKSVMGTIGFITGIHYWSIEIMIPGGGGIMIGISDHLLVSKSNFAGIFPKVNTIENGVSYNGATGKLYCGDKLGIPYGPSYTKGDVIGTLLNMNRKTITFYKNGIRIGTAANVECLIGDEYYPCISLSSSNQKIGSVNHNIFTPQQTTTSNNKNTNNDNNNYKKDIKVEI